MLESEEVDKAEKQAKALIGGRYANYLRILSNAVWGEWTTSWEVPPYYDEDVLLRANML
jgi:hypothetical protein